VQNLKEITDRHKHWIKVVEGFGEKQYAQDIVQEAYIKVINLNKEINFAYFYFTLRSLTMDLHRKKVDKIEITQEIEYSLKEDNYQEEVSEFVKPYMDFINTWDWYDKKMYLIYITNNVSMRKMAKESGIPLMNIFQTIQRCKLKLKLWQKENQKG
jgi:DNA-directed RNA polymerase specialized sigma24 family protein